MIEQAQTFAPDWVSPPGETVEDLLEERSWSQVELAERTGLTRKHINDLVKGRAPITADTASRLDLREVEREAERIPCRPFDKQAFKAALPRLRELTANVDPRVFVPEVQRICAELNALKVSYEWVQPEGDDG